VSLDTRIVHRLRKRATSCRRDERAAFPDSRSSAIERRIRSPSSSRALPVWTLPTAVTATAVPRIALTVRVYQTAGLPSALEKRALAEAETVLGAGLVDVRWQECDVPPGPSELLLVVREGAPCQDTPATLGEALVVRRAGGVLATVYVNCVTWLATAARTDVTVLLGRVAAHELGQANYRSLARCARSRVQFRRRRAHGRM
jgi:hypothetical protein